MSFQSDFYTAIQADATITSIVGSRIFAYVAPSTATAPFIVYQVIGTGGQTAHDGTRPVEFPLIQISCWSESPAASIALASAVNAFADGNTISGDSDLSLVFSGQSGQYDQATKLFGEILEFSGHANTN